MLGHYGQERYSKFRCSGISHKLSFMYHFTIVADNDRHSPLKTYGLALVRVLSMHGAVLYHSETTTLAFEWGGPMDVYKYCLIL